jgi:hypothetical protein
VHLEKGSSNTNYCYINYNKKNLVRQRPATLHYLLNVYLNGLATLNVYLAGLLQYIFFGFYLFICNVLCSQFGQYCASTTLLVHWFMLYSYISTGFLFVYCCCSCLFVRLVSFFTFGVLQVRFELHHSWCVDCFLILCSLDGVYCCLIRLSRVRVLWLQLGLLVLLNWVVIC